MIRFRKKLQYLTEIHFFYGWNAEFLYLCRPQIRVTKYPEIQTKGGN